MPSSPAPSGANAEGGKGGGEEEAEGGVLPGRLGGVLQEMQVGVPWCSVPPLD